MAEKQIVVSGIQVSYTGFFDMKELFGILEHWIKDMNYDKEEVAHEVKVYEDGRHINLHLEPYKSITDYIKHVIRIKLNVSGLKDVVIKVDGKDKKLQDGTISISLEGLSLSHLEGRWVSNPLNYFMRIIIDKYIYSGYIKDYNNILRGDIQLLYTELNSYLNTNKFRFK